MRIWQFLHPSDSSAISIRERLPLVRRIQRSPLFMSWFLSRSPRITFSQQKTLHIHRAALQHHANEVSVIMYGSLSLKAISWVHFWTTGDHGRVLNLARIPGFSDEKVTNTKTMFLCFLGSLNAAVACTSWVSVKLAALKPSKRATGGLPRKESHLTWADFCIWTAV